MDTANTTSAMSSSDESCTAPIDSISQQSTSTEPMRPKKSAKLITKVLSAFKALDSDAGVRLEDVRNHLRNQGLITSNPKRSILQILKGTMQGVKMGMIHPPSDDSQWLFRLVSKLNADSKKGRAKNQATTAKKRSSGKNRARSTTRKNRKSSKKSESSSGSRTRRRRRTSRISRRKRTGSNTRSRLGRAKRLGMRSSRRRSRSRGVRARKAARTARRTLGRARRASTFRRKRSAQKGRVSNKRRANRTRTGNRRLGARKVAKSGQRRNARR